MKWFKDGLNQDELKKAYRDLVKEHHPDVSKDPNATAIMQEINEEFDQYFTMQATRQYSWVNQSAARAAARTTRKIIVRYFTRDQDDRSKFVASFSLRQYWSWLFSTRTVFRLIADPKKPDWKDFRGGFAACAVDVPESRWDQMTTSNLEAHRIDSRITPATLEEIYWYIIAKHTSDYGFEYEWNEQGFSPDIRYVQYKTRVGTIWVGEPRDSYYNDGHPVAFMKVEYYDEQAAIGGFVPTKERVRYNAKQIQEIQVPQGVLTHSDVLDEVDGNDIPYKLFQDCTRYDFDQFHDVGVVPEMSKLVQLKKIRSSDAFIAGWPMVEYYARKGIIQLYELPNNFRVRCGHFNREKLEVNMHLLSIDDAEEIQDYLDEINKDFDEKIKSMVRSGKIRYKV